jgi:hypothetical protein
MGVLANGLEQPITGMAVRLVGEHERTPDQAAEMLENVERVDDVRSDDRLSILERAAPRENGQAIEHDSLVIAQEVIGPVDRPPQRLMALHRAPRTAAQQPELVVEPYRDLARGHRLHPRRSQLDCERNATEATTDLDDRGRIVVV